MVNRRDLIGMGSAILGLAALTTQKAAAQSTSVCQPPQHFVYQQSSQLRSDCSNIYIQIYEVFKVTVQTCPNADGSQSFRIHQESHGTGQGYDSDTGQLTGTKYVINYQQHDRQVLGPPPTQDACPGFSDVYTIRQELISKGSAPNEKILAHQTFSVDSSCNVTIDFKLDIDCGE